MLAFLGFTGLASSAAAEPPASKVSFNVASLFPKFSPGVHDYVVRCNDAPVTVQIRMALSQ